MQQTNFKCSAGNVRIHSATMLRASGYGQYSIQIDAEYRGKREILKHHSTDSQLFDLLGDMESDADRAAHILRTYLAEKMIEDWVAEIPDVDEGTVPEEIMQYFGGVSNVDRFMTNTGISSDKKGQVLDILRSADKKWQDTEGEYPEQAEALDAIIEETSKKLAAL